MQAALERDTLGLLSELSRFCEMRCGMSNTLEPFAHT